MRKSGTAAFPELLTGNGIIKDQVYHALREAILSGRLHAGSKVPSGRALAEMMGISRNSVIAGFERLQDEGYLVTRRGAGTFVAENLPDHAISGPVVSPADAAGEQVTANISPLAETLLSQRVASGASSDALFMVGTGCVDLFPHDVWGRLLGRVWRQSRYALHAHSEPHGYPPLRRAICHYVRATRGLQCDEDQILIVNGTQQAINLTVQTLLQPGDEVWLDDPGYDGARGAFLSQRLTVRPVRADEEGMDVYDGLRRWPDAKLVFTAPSHQFPGGGTLSLARRSALLSWAAKHHVWILEDDYNGEFRYADRPLQALQGLDRHQRVIYAGTFSKMLYPAFRLGFLVVPKALIPAFEVAKYYADTGCGYLEQATLTRFINEGHYARHVRRVRKACYERRQAVTDAINQYLPALLAIVPSDSGIHLLCRMKNGVPAQTVIRAGRQCGMGMQPLARYCRPDAPQEGVLFGFAAYPAEKLTDGIRRLAEVLQAQGVVTV